MREEKLRAYLKDACAGRKYRVSGAELEQAQAMTICPTPEALLTCL